MYAFLGHKTAVSALRLLSSERGMPQLTDRWPACARPLPSPEHCIRTQRQFRAAVPSLGLHLIGASSSPVDLLVPSNISCSRGRSARFHIWSGSVPAQSMFRLGESLLLSGPELAILQLCGSQAKLEPLIDANVQAYRSEKELMDELGIAGKPAIDDPLRWEQIARLVRAVELACEFAGTYRLPSQDDSDAAYRIRPLMSCGSLADMARSRNLSVMESRALRVADIAFDNSGSPMETSLALMLTLPVEWGGFGLPHPKLNRTLDTSPVRGMLSDRCEVTPDLSWEGGKLALEYDSAEKHGHAGAQQLAEDALRGNILTALGYRVLRVTPGAVSTIPKMELLARQIASLLGVDLAIPNELQVLRRSKLFLELWPQRG